MATALAGPLRDWQPHEIFHPRPVPGDDDCGLATGWWVDHRRSATLEQARRASERVGEGQCHWWTQPLTDALFVDITQRRRERKGGRK
jgi:hypothetical protein